MIPTSLARVVLWNGGLPLPPLESVMLPLAERDLDPYVRSSLTPPVRLNDVRNALVPSVFRSLPHGWTLAGKHTGVPQIHLQYSGPDLANTPFQGTVADVFLCIASSTKDEVPRLRVLYIRDLPMPGDNRPGRFSVEPYDVPAAWLTLFVRGSKQIITSWRSSSDVKAYFTLEGEVLGNDL